jgi:hypothetical protein
MYRRRPSFIIGFHGCDESVRDKLVMNPNSIVMSEKPYDWLGNGFYVWENNYQRALQWAKDKKKRGEIETPSVLGVLLLLDNCLDFTDSEFIYNIGDYFNLMKVEYEALNEPLPRNKNIDKDSHKDRLIRELDCSVIEFMHEKIEEQIITDNKAKGYSDLSHFDTARGIFTEGGPAFEGAGIQKKNHIQICIRNSNSIKGFFIPRKETKFP